MAETYIEMNERHQREINALPLKFAFSNKQYDDILKAWNITPDEAKAGALLSIGGGGYVRAEDKQLYTNTVERIYNETQTAIEEDKTGEGFIYQMFLYELANHEFSYTLDTEETLMALGIEEEEIKNNSALRRGLCKAVAKLMQGE